VQTPEAMLADPGRFQRVNAVAAQLAERLAKA
jgi:hypothetical protein